MATIFTEVCKQPVRVNENGVSREITKLQAGITQLANKAAAGDVRAIREILHWSQILEAGLQTDVLAPSQHELDKELMANLVERIRKADSSRNQTDAEPEKGDPE